MVSKDYLFCLKEKIILFKIVLVFSEWCYFGWFYIAKYEQFFGGTLRVEIVLLNLNVLQNTYPYLQKISNIILSVHTRFPNCFSCESWNMWPFYAGSPLKVIYRISDVWNLLALTLQLLGILQNVLLKENNLINHWIYIHEISSVCISSHHLLIPECPICRVQLLI